MKLHLRIAQNCYRRPGLARELVSQEMIDRRAGFFIFRGSRDARDASVSVKPQGAVSFICSGSYRPRSAFVLPSLRPPVQKMNEVGLGRFSMHGS